MNTLIIFSFLLGVAIGIFVAAVIWGKSPFRRARYYVTYNGKLQELDEHENAISQ